MNGRVYSPNLGRMLSPDPVTQAPENGQNYNRYTYSFNNPLKFSDPSGYKTKEGNAACIGDSCNQSPSFTGEEVVVVAQDLSGGTGVTGNTAALTFGVGSGAQAAMDQNMNEQFSNGVEATALENDIQNGAIIGVTASGDLVDSDGNPVSQFDYFYGNYAEWGALPPEFEQLFADIRAAGINFTGVDGLIGSTWGAGIYYDTETGEFGIYYVSGGGLHLMDNEVVSGFELSVSFIGTWAPSEEAFFGSSQSTSGIAVPLTPYGVGLATGSTVSSSGTTISGGISLGGGASTVTTSTGKVVLH